MYPRRAILLIPEEAWRQILPASAEARPRALIRPDSAEVRWCEATVEASEAAAEEEVLATISWDARRGGNIRGRRRWVRLRLWTREGTLCQEGNF